MALLCTVTAWRISRLICPPPACGGAAGAALILKAINQAVSRLYVHESTDEDAA